MTAQEPRKVMNRRRINQSTDFSLNKGGLGNSLQPKEFISTCLNQDTNMNKTATPFGFNPIKVKKLQ